MLSTTTAETPDLYGKTYNVTTCALFTPYTIFPCFVANSSRYFTQYTVGSSTSTTTVTTKTHDNDDNDDDNAATATPSLPTSLVLRSSRMTALGHSNTVL